MSGRKSQVEKFNKKWGATQAEANRVAEEKAHKAIKEETVEAQGEKVAVQNGMKKDEVFMVLGREAMPIFTNMFANSVRTAVKEELAGVQATIKEDDNMKEVIREVVREELQGAFKDFLAGMMQAAAVPVAPVEVPVIVGKIEEVEVPVVKAKKAEPIKRTGRGSVVKEYTKDMFFEACRTAEESGLVLTDKEANKLFKRVSPRHNTIYQRMNQFSGMTGKGQFEKLVQEYLATK